MKKKKYYTGDLQEQKVYKRTLKQKIIGKLMCQKFGHPQSGNIYIVGLDTYCERCGRMNLP